MHEHKTTRDFKEETFKAYPSWASYSGFFRLSPLLLRTVYFSLPNSIWLLIFRSRDTRLLLRFLRIISKLSFWLRLKASFLEIARTPLKVSCEWILRSYKVTGLFICIHHSLTNKFFVASIALIIFLKLVRLVRYDLDPLWYFQGYWDRVLFFHAVHLVHKPFLRLEALISTVHHEPDVKV